MESKGVTLTMLNGGALVVELLLRRRQLREVLAGDVHLDSAIDLLLARVLLDALNLERRLLRVAFFAADICSCLGFSPKAGRYKESQITR